MSMDAPSPLQIALAIAVVRSKPDGITVRDYILHLRRHVRYGRQVQPEDSCHRHLDSVSYWRDKCRRAEAKCHDLEDRLVQLECEKETLEAQVATGSGSRSSKRKRDSTRVTRSSKKALVDQEHGANVLQAAAQDFAHNDADALDVLGQAGQTLANALFHAHGLYRQAECAADQLSFHLVAIARGISSVIAAACDPLGTEALAAATSDRDGLSLAIRVAARAFSSLLVGLNRIAAHDSSKRLVGCVIYESVRMFQGVLDCIAQLATSCASSDPQHASTTKAVSGSGSSSTNAAKPPQASRALSQFLNAALSYLDRADPVHRQLFEGFLFALFDRVAERLYLCNFQHARGASVEADIVRGAAPSPTPGASRAELMALRLELPPLVVVLERALALAPYHLTPASASSSATAAKAAASRAPTSAARRALPSRTPLSQHARDRLQRTLVHRMFGDEDTERDDFADMLRMPARLGGLPALKKVADTSAENGGGVRQWFISEIWRLVGWDVLARDAAL